MLPQEVIYAKRNKQTLPPAEIYEFVKALAENRISEGQVAAFASFGFAKSHAAAFARTAYESAFLKLFYPAQFLVGLINAQPMGFYPVEVLVNDAKRHGVAVLPVDLNASTYKTTTEWVGRPGEPLPPGAGIDARPEPVRSPHGSRDGFPRKRYPRRHTPSEMSRAPSSLQSLGSRSPPVAPPLQASPTPSRLESRWSGFGVVSQLSKASGTPAPTLTSYTASASSTPSMRSPWPRRTASRWSPVAVTACSRRSARP